MLEKESPTRLMQQAKRDRPRRCSRSESSQAALVAQPGWGKSLAQGRGPVGLVGLAEQPGSDQPWAEKAGVLRVWAETVVVVLLVAT